MTSPEDYYKILGISPDASEREIRQAFRKKAFETHPDRNKSPGAEEQFKRLNRAYETLYNAAKRAEYDRTFGQGKQQQSWQQRQQSARPRPGASAGAGQSYQQRGRPRPDEQYAHGTPDSQGFSSGGSQNSRGSGGSGVFVDGVELPREFAGRRTVINLNGRRVIISYDGTKYAVTNGEVYVHDMPSDGRLRFDGWQISYETGPGRQPFVRVSGHGQNIAQSSGGTISISKGFSFSLGGLGFGGVYVSSSSSSGSSGSLLEEEINKSYDNVSRVSVNHGDGEMSFGFSKDGRVYVRGNVSEEPQLVAGNLCISGLDGVLELLLPRNYGIELSVRTGDGSIRGDIASPGSIMTGDGAVNLNIFSPLELLLRTADGRVSVSNMKSEGHGLYSPIGPASIGRLSVSTGDGDINIAYRGA